MMMIMCENKHIIRPTRIGIKHMYLPLHRLLLHIIINTPFLLLTVQNILLHNMVLLLGLRLVHLR